VTLHAESDDVLESLHEGSVSGTKLMLAVIWSVVSNHDGETFLSLNFKELLFEPCKVVAWVVPLTPGEPVEIVACLRVVGNDSGAGWQLLTVEQFHLHAVVAILTKLLHGLVVQPLGPVRLEVVDWEVEAWG
jgi:hypothetical protein